MYFTVTIDVGKCQSVWFPLHETQIPFPTLRWIYYHHIDIVSYNCCLFYTV